MDRIKRLSMEILENNKDRFGTDFAENKRALDDISIIRSKGLKNELAGFITKLIKREIREKEEKQAEENRLEQESQERKPDEKDVAAKAETISQSTESSN